MQHRSTGRYSWHTQANSEGEIDNKNHRLYLVFGGPGTGKPWPRISSCSRPIFSLVSKKNDTERAKSVEGILQPGYGPIG